MSSNIQVFFIGLCRHLDDGMDFSSIRNHINEELLLVNLFIVTDTYHHVHPLNFLCIHLS